MICSPTPADSTGIVKCVGKASADLSHTKVNITDPSGNVNSLSTPGITLEDSDNGSNPGSLLSRTGTNALISIGFSLTLLALGFTLNRLNRKKKNHT